MLKYIVDKYGNARIVQTGGAAGLIHKLRRITSVFFWFVAAACVAAYLIFYLDLPSQNHALDQIRSRMDGCLAASSYLQHHLQSKWSALSANAERLWEQARDYFLAFRQEVR